MALADGEVGGVAADSERAAAECGPGRPAADRQKGFGRGWSADRLLLLDC